MKHIYFLFFLSLIVGNIFGQDTFYTSEKVYIHTDRDLYAIGDTIWLKAYLFDSQNHHLSRNSTLLYLTFIDSHGKIITKQKLQLKEGQATSNWVILPYMFSETIQIVAYTNLMRNQDKDYFFKKSIKIFRREVVENKTGISSERAKIENWNVQFFPEGGELVVGVRNKVAFKAVNQYGNGIEIGGYIKTEKDDLVNEIKAEYLGMGAFTLIPQQNTSYKAFIEYQGIKREFDLPPVKAAGFTMNVDNINSKLGILIDVVGHKLGRQKLHLWAHQRGKVIFQTTLDTQQNEKLFLLKNEMVPQDGIVQITLFDTDFIPIAERVVFVNRNLNNFEIQLNTIASNIGKHEKIELQILTKQQQKVLPNAQISVSIVDAEQVENNTESPNILSYLLLCSDLKGNIEKPNAYFEMESSKSKYFLDLLMLTQGWRRFIWKDTSKNTKHEIEKQIILSGTLTRRDKIIASEDIILSTWDDDGLRITPTRSDSLGHIMLSGSWRGTIKVIVVDKKGREIDFILDVEPSSSINISLDKGGIFGQSSISGNSLVQYEFGNNSGILLDEVVVKGQIADPLKGDSRRALYGEPDVSLEITKDIVAGAAYLDKMLEGRLVGIAPGALSDGNDDDIPKSTFGQNVSAISGPPAAGSSGGSQGAVMAPMARRVLILLDGVMIPSSFLRSISPSIVERVDLLRDITKTSMYGLNCGNCKVINILTKRGINTDIQTFASKKAITLSGYEPVRQFYQPDYAVNKPTKPDYRATLYWNPNIMTDKNGHATVTFYNSDIAKKLRATIEGTDGLGNVGSFIWEH